MQFTGHEPPLMHGPGHAPDPIPAGDALALAWHEIDAVLAPILGKRGSAAIYERSLQLQLAGAESESTSLLQTVRELLGPMIGAGLTERLLDPLDTLVSAGTEHSQAVGTGYSLP
jgi:hypothetical protein